MKTIVGKQNDVLRQAAEQICGIVREKRDAALALSALGAAPALYDCLASLSAAGDLSLRDCRVFAAEEFVAAPEERSCRAALEELFAASDLRRENCVFLTEENLDSLDAAIAAAGGLDLAVLGLGHNARIGFNEPATPFASLSRRQKLTDATKRELAGRFGGIDRVPDYGLTLGIRTLTQAREILVVSLGEDEADAAFKMLYARNDSAVPAAFLQIPSRVTVYLDEEAGAKI